MKKISIILSAALLAATFALAGCSNVSELNGTEWDVYSAGASGKTAAQVAADNAAEAEKISLVLDGTMDSKAIAKIENKVNIGDVVGAGTSTKIITLKFKDSGAKLSAEWAVDTKTFTYAGITYKNKKAAKDATSVDFYALSSAIVTSASAGDSSLAL